MKSLEFFVSHFDACGIGIAILDRRDRESFIGPRVGDQFNDGLQRGQRFGTPVDGNVGKQPVLDRVPLARAWRKMADHDGEARLVGQPLHFALPQACP